MNHEQKQPALFATYLEHQFLLLMSEAARKRELKSKQKRIGGLELFNDDVCFEG